MAEIEQVEHLPVAYALLLWLRELGCDVDRIAAALDVAPESVVTLSRIAELKQVRARDEIRAGSKTGCDVAVFVDGPDVDLIDDAATLARVRDATLHLVARKGSRFGSVVAAAQRALNLDVPVNLVAAVGRRADALRSLASTAGTLTVLSNAWKRD